MSPSKVTVVRGKRCGRGHDEWYRNGVCFRCAVCARNWHAKYPIRSMLNRCRVRARRDGIECTITEADIQAVWPKDGRCPALRIKLARKSGSSGGGKTSPALDRIDPTRGYVPGNIAVISGHANSIKTNATADQVMAVAHWMNRVNLKGKT